MTCGWPDVGLEKEVKCWGEGDGCSNAAGTKRPVEMEKKKGEFDGRVQDTATFGGGSKRGGVKRIWTLPTTLLLFENGGSLNVRIDRGRLVRKR